MINQKSSIDIQTLQSIGRSLRGGVPIDIFLSRLEDTLKRQRIKEIRKLKLKKIFGETI